MSYHRRELRLLRFLALLLFAVGVSLAIGAVFMSARWIDVVGRVGAGVSGAIFATLAGVLAIGIRRLGGKPADLNSSGSKGETEDGKQERYSWQELALAERAALGFVAFGAILIVGQVVVWPMLRIRLYPIVVEGFGTTGVILIVLGLILRARVRKLSIVPGDHADLPPHQTWHGGNFESADANDARRNDPGSIGGIY